MTGGIFCLPVWEVSSGALENSCNSNIGQSAESKLGLSGRSTLPLYRTLWINIWASQHLDLVLHCAKKFICVKSLSLGAIS